MVIAVDFDGTCVAHEYPSIGHHVGSVAVLEELVAEGHELILFTMRSGPELEEAVWWFKCHGLPLKGVNVNPTQAKWTASPKAYAQLYLDDAALGAPLKKSAKLGVRPHYDWEKAREMLIEMGVLKGENK